MEYWIVGAFQKLRLFYIVNFHDGNVLRRKSILTLHKIVLFRRFSFAANKQISPRKIAAKEALKRIISPELIIVKKRFYEIFRCRLLPSTTVSKRILQFSIIVSCWVYCGFFLRFAAALSSALISEIITWVLRSWKPSVMWAQLC